MPIHLFARHAEEQRPSTNFSTVISKRPNLYGGVPNDSGPGSSGD